MCFFNKPEFLKIRHFIPDRSGTEGNAVFLGKRPRAYRLGGTNKVINDHLQNQQLTIS